MPTMTEWGIGRDSPVSKEIAEYEARTGKEWWEVLGMSCDVCPCCREDGLCDAKNGMVNGCYEAYEIKKGSITK